MAFHRPMNRAAHAHIRSTMPVEPVPGSPVFLDGGARPNARFQELCALAGRPPRANAGPGTPEPWELKDPRKTCATYHDAHVPESSVEPLGHSVGGITYRHHTRRAPPLSGRSRRSRNPQRARAGSGVRRRLPCYRRRFTDAEESRSR